MKRCVILEPEAEEVCNASAIPPKIYQLPSQEGREILEEAQDTPVFMHPARSDSMRMDTGKWGEIPLYVVSSREAIVNPANVIFYIHGVGWEFGSFHTHEKLERKLAARTGCIVVFPEYSRSPEARYPVAVGQCYSVLCQLKEILLC